MFKKLFCALLILNVLSSTAQSQKQYAFNLYSTVHQSFLLGGWNTINHQYTTFSTNQGQHLDIRETHQTWSQNFVPSLTIWNDKKYTEIGLSALSFSTKDIEVYNNSLNAWGGGGVRNQFDLGLFIERGYHLFVKDTSKLTIHLGIGMNPYFANHKVEMAHTIYAQGIDHKQYRLGISSYLNPRIKRKFNKYALELGIPIHLVSAQINSSFIDNPAIPPQSQRVTTGDLEILPKVSLRLGFSVNL